MDHFSYLIDREHRFLLIGIVLLILGTLFALIGETLEPRHGIVCRTEEPKRFWGNIVFYFLGGLIFVVLYLYQNSR